MNNNIENIRSYKPKPGYKIIYRYFDAEGSYIGQTKKSIKGRAGKNGKNYLTNDNKWSRAIMDKGFDHFEVEILDECLEEDANKREKEFIKKFDSRKNGYNSTPGGLCYNPNYDYDNYGYDDYEYDPEFEEIMASPFWQQELDIPSDLPEEIRELNRELRAGDMPYRCVGIRNKSDESQAEVIMDVNNQEKADDIDHTICIKDGKEQEILQKYIDENIHTAADQMCIDSIIATGKAEGKTWTVQQLKDMFAQGHIDNNIYGTGFSSDELAQVWGVTLEQLRDPNNWDNTVFRNPNDGMCYKTLWIEF